MTKVTDTFLYPQHEVRFSDQVSIIYSNLTEDLVQELLFSSQEIQDFHKQVRFCDQVNIINSNLTEELVQELWFSRQEIQDFHKEAKQQAKNFREQHSELVQEFATLVRTCTKESSLKALFRSSRAQQIMKSLPGTTVRGLEGHLHVIVRRHRVLHRQGVLAIQKRCPKKHDAEFLEQLLRSISLYTSRASRSLARLLAHGDSLHMTAIFRQELRESNEDIVSVD
jgi:diadenosine tetraphosphate (Ap4A) HIT family hydrolase